MIVKPKDIIAGMVVVGYFVAKYIGFDGDVNTAFMLIIGYYFVKRQTKIDNGF